MRFRVAQIPLFLLLIAFVGFVAGLRVVPLMIRPPVVLVGSGNGHSFLREGSALSKMDPLWLDIGSSGAMQQAFAGFDYGRSIGSRPRVAFAAMSSNGTKALESLFSAADNNLQGNNYWLSLSVARPPLAILYRGAITRYITVLQGTKRPPEAGSTDAT
jgi:hypothetical protein